VTVIPSEGCTGEWSVANSSSPQTANHSVSDRTRETAARGLSLPLIELIDIPGPEQLRTIARTLGLVDAVQQRLDREAAERKASGEAA
jgi:hypothetical protein